MAELVPPTQGDCIELRLNTELGGRGVGHIQAEVGHLRQAVWAMPVRSMSLTWASGGDSGTQGRTVNFHSSLLEFAQRRFCVHLFWYRRGGYK